MSNTADTADTGPTKETEYTWEQRKATHIDIYKRFMANKWDTLDTKMNDPVVRKQLFMTPELDAEWKKIRKLPSWGKEHSFLSAQGEEFYAYHQFFVAMARNFLARGVCPDTPRAFREQLFGEDIKIDHEKWGVFWKLTEQEVQDSLIFGWKEKYEKAVAAWKLAVELGNVLRSGSEFDRTVMDDLGAQTKKYIREKVAATDFSNAFYPIVCIQIRVYDDAPFGDKLEQWRLDTLKELGVEGEMSQEAMWPSCSLSTLCAKVKKR